MGEHVENVPLIDHHVHGCWLQSGDRTRFENGLNEANTEPIAEFDSSFDTQLGFAVRAHGVQIGPCDEQRQSLPRCWRWSSRRAHQPSESTWATVPAI